MNTILQNVNTEMIKQGKTLSEACNWNRVSESIDDMKYVRTYANIHPWDWESLSRNPYFEMEDALQLKDDYPLVWGQYGLSMNPSQFLLIKHYPDEFDWFWGLGGVSSNRGIILEFIEEHSERLDFRMGGVSSMPCITLQFVLKHPEYPWFWGEYGLSTFLDVSPKDVEAHPDLPWNYEALEKNRFYVKHTKSLAL